MTSRPAVIVVCVLLAALATAAYFPGLAGPYLLDDYPNLLHNRLLQIRDLSADSLASAWWSNASGFFGRPLPALSFGVNFYLADTSFAPVAFKSVNLAIHVFNAVLVYGLATLLLRAVGPVTAPGGPDRTCGAPEVRMLAFCVAAAWALHPIQLSNVLYVVQRINSIAALAVLGGLLVWCAGRQRLADGRSGAWPRMVGGLCGGLLVGMLSKENAALLPALALVTELAVYRGRTGRPESRRLLWAWHAVTGVLPVVAAGFYAVVVLDLWASAYAYRDFDVVERLMTQSRVVLWYLGQLLAPDIGALSFFHDHWTVSRGLLDPPSTLGSIVALLALVAGAALAWRRSPWPAFGIGWFLVGHAMESTVVPLEMVFEHRNYVPSAGLLLAVGALIAHGLTMARVGSVLRGVVAVAMVLALGGATHLQARVWADKSSLILVSLERRPDSWRLHNELASLLEKRGGDVRGMYAALAGAGRVAPDQLLPHLSMLRLVGFIEAAEEDSSQGPSSPVVDRYGEVVLRTDAASLADERARLTRHIGRLLGRPQAMESDVFSAFQSLVNCADGGSRACLALAAPMEQWTRTVLDNPHLPVAQRQSFTWLRARMRQAAGDSAGVLPSIEEGIALDPGAVQLLLHRVGLALTLGEVAMAERWLGELRPLVVAPEDRLQLKALEAGLAQ